MKWAVVRPKRLMPLLKRTACAKGGSRIVNAVVTERGVEKGEKLHFRSIQTLFESSSRLQPAQPPLHPRILK